jgi:hypothetical protein
MNVNIGVLQLHSALKTLRLRGDDARLIWTDSVRRDFEDNHWEPLVAQVMATHRAMEHLAQIVGIMRQECS